MKLFLSVSLNDLLPTSDINTGMEEVSKGLKSFLEQISSASSFVSGLFNTLPDSYKTIVFVALGLGILIGIIKIILEVI